jgi:hypothetical protein
MPGTWEEFHFQCAGSINCKAVAHDKFEEMIFIGKHQRLSRSPGGVGGTGDIPDLPRRLYSIIIILSGLPGFDLSIFFYQPSL